MGICSSTKARNPSQRSEKQIEDPQTSLPTSLTADLVNSIDIQENSGDT